MRRASRRTLAAAFACLLLASPPAFAADGDLDTDFHFDGFNTKDCGFSEERGEDMALQPDGKVVLVARSSEGQACLTRLTATGSLDPDFGSFGSVVLAADGSVFVSAVAVQSDGKILVAGSIQGEEIATIVFRRNADGSPDTTFDGDGHAINRYSPSTVDGATELAIQPDGRILVVGQAVENVPGAVANPAILRLDGSGQLDTTFSGDGRTVADVGGHSVDAVALPGNRIVLAGAPLDDDLARGLGALGFTPDGSLDPLFGPTGNGRIAVFGEGGDRAFDAIVAPDGGVLLTGSAVTAGAGRIAAAVKLDPGGRLDRAFSADGVATFSFGGASTSEARSAANTIDGKFAVAGFTGSGQLAVAKLTPDGALDGSFGGGGTGVYDGVPVAAGAIARQPDGKLVVGGAAPSGAGAARIDDSFPEANVAGASAREGSVAPFLVTLTKTSGFPVSFSFVTGTGIAADPVDFIGRSGTLTIPAGQTTGVVGIATVLDRLFEPNETFWIEFADPANATLGLRIAPGTIQNALRSGRCANLVVGRAGIDIITGSPRGDLIRGRPGDDVLFGLAGADCLSGERGHDQLDGGNGSDRIDGGSGDDRLKGDGGNDRIVGGRGRNRYSGGTGNDTIYARNGRAEIVECGPGRDRAKVDRNDRTRRCERVTRSRG